MEAWIYGSTAAGCEAPNDLDIALIFPSKARLDDFFNNSSINANVSRFPDYKQLIRTSTIIEEKSLHLLLLTEEDFAKPNPLNVSIQKGFVITDFSDM